MTTTSRFMGKPLLRAAIISAVGLLIAAALVMHWHRSQARLQTAFERLQLVQGLRAAALEDLISSLQTDIEAASESPRMKAVITELVGAWRDLGPAGAGNSEKRLSETSGRTTENRPFWRGRAASTEL